MHSKIRYASYSLVGISIAITLLLPYPDANRSRAKARAVVPAADLRAGTTATVEETVTLKPSDLKTWQWNTTWVSEPGPCDTVLQVPHQEPPYGQVIVGYIHQYDVYHKYLYILDCSEEKAAVFQGSMWFDLSEIINKAPSVYVTKATLNYKKIDSVARDNRGDISRQCADRLMSASVDWRKEGYGGLLVPGVDPLPVGCGPGGCSVDVHSVVNNWVRGEEHGGDANYGFVIKGEDEASAESSRYNRYVCQTRYGDFSLTVTYSFPIKKPYTPPETYPLVCRGTDILKVGDLDGPAGFRWVGFTFIPGTKPANDGLLPGQCSWRDRGMRAGEPGRLAQPIEGAVAWMKDLNSPDSYWTFDVYNAGGQLQATKAERNKRIFVPLLRTNYALASNGGKAVASSKASFPASYANDGERAGAGSAVWLDDTLGVFPDSLEIDFAGPKTIDQIDVITRQDNIDTPVDPKDLSQTFTLYGITIFDVQYWDASSSSWITVPGGNVGRGKFAPSPNDKVWRQFTGFKVTTDKIRIVVKAGKDNTYSRIVEVEAWGN
jgi:hypothetical protein